MLADEGMMRNPGNIKHAVLILLVLFLVGCPPYAVTIISPSDGASYGVGEEIAFTGSAIDLLEGELPGDSLVWTSDKEGEIGQGKEFKKDDLSEGTHEITLTATNSQGEKGTATITITIGGETPITTTTLIITTTTTSIEDEQFDECGNELGNGNEIISGPSGHEGDYNIDNPFSSLTVHPLNPDIVLQGTERNGFLKSTDGGNTWVRLRKGVRHDAFTEEVPGREPGYPEVYDIAFSESNPESIYAATLSGPGPLAGEYGADGGIYKSTDGGQTWQRKNCGLDNGFIWSVHVMSDPDNVIIGISGGEVSGWGTPISGKYYDGGIFRSTDGGENWNRVDLGQYDNVSAYRTIKVAKSNPSIIYIFGLNMDDNSKGLGFVRSNDGGLTWELFAPELRERGINYFDISSDGSVIYAPANDYKIFKSADAGETWSEYHIGTTGYAIAVSPIDPNRVLFSKVDGLYLSTDGLQTESQVITVTDTTGKGHISDVVFAPADNNIVYVITAGYNFYKSTDAGETFTKIINLRDEVLNVIP